MQEILNLQHLILPQLGFIISLSHKHLYFFFLKINFCFLCAKHSVTNITEYSNNGHFCDVHVALRSWPYNLYQTGN